jgi:hypothetical protein
MKPTTMLLTDYTSYIFNLVIFTFIAIWISLKILKIRIEAGEYFSKKFMYDWFTVFCLFAILTQLSYVYAPERIFSNASHHIIEHLGYSFGKQLNLVSQQNPEEALWDDKSGKLTLTTENESGNFTLKGSSFYEPIYVKNGDAYKLSNPVSSTPIQKQLDIVIGDTLGLSFHIGEKENTLYSISTHVNNKTYGPFIVPINQPFQTGYSIGAMLNRMAIDSPELSNLVLALEDVLLVRELYSKNKKESQASSLLFFPSPLFMQSNASIKIDGKDINLTENKDFEIPLTKDNSFFIGLWNTQIKTYAVEQKEDVSKLLVTFPGKKYLKKLDGGQETLFLTSSANEISDNDLVSGFYYPLLENEANQNHFSSTLTYSEGPTIEKMAFKVINLDQDDLETAGNQTTFAAGDTIYIKTKGFIAGTNSNQWLFRIKDQKADNPLQCWHLLTFTLLILLMIFISVYLTPLTEQSKTEYIIYVFVLTIMTIRSVLLWRASTFIPTEDISENIYTNLTSGMFSNFKNGVYGTVTFFVLVWISKIFGKRMLKKTSPPLSNSFNWRSYLWFGLYSLPFIIKFLGINQLERIGAVYLPVFIYVFIEFWFLRKLHLQKQSSVQSKNYRFMAVINWLVCFSSLALFDAGFSIVFFIATLIYWLLQLLAFPDYLSNPYPSTYFGKLKHWRFIVPIILLGGFIYAVPHLISFVFLKTKVFLTLTSVLLVLSTGYLLYRQKTTPVLTKVIAAFGVIAFAVALILQNDWIVEKIQEKNYVRYRAEVLFRTPDEIIQDESFEFNLGNDSKLLRAAQNQWFINYYYENGVTGWIQPFVELTKGNYFRLLPSFQKGSPYLTQISDLVSVRYIIGEHSQIIILNLLILMIILILSALDIEMKFNFFSKLRVLILCLFFTVGFFIWMAATNRIVFLGQDFPLLSLNSILTLLFTFTILFFTIFFGNQARKQETLNTFSTFGQMLFGKIIRWVLFGAILLITVRKHDFSEKRFNLDNTIESLKSNFIQLNETFAGFQIDNKNKYKSVSELTTAFDAYLQTESRNIFKTEFSKSAYDAYIRVLKKNNNPQNLIHIRRGNDGIYEFAINKLYYDVASPEAYGSSWQGHLINADSPNAFRLKNRDTKLQYVIDPNKIANNLAESPEANKLAKLSENGNIRLSVIPASWTPDSLPKVLISTTLGQQAINRSSFTIKNDGEIIHSEAMPFALALDFHDIVQFTQANDRKAVTLQYSRESNSYLAKNVWLNGKNQFFYPMKHKFLWPYHFANLVKSKFDGDASKQHKNLALTIDPILTEQIYDQADKFFSVPLWTGIEAPIEKKRAFNLVVIDSDGKIKALSDYKKGAPLKFDPNKISEYREKLDRIYLNSESDNERLIFGNRCLMRSDNGPASTFKPILYAAVCSQFDFNWNKLKFGGLNTNAGFVKSAGANSFKVTKFGGKPVKFYLDSPNMGLHDNIYYISHSTNSYNSMIAFLGSLDKTEIRNLKKYVDGTSTSLTFLKSGLSKNEEKNFPDFQINEQPYHINNFPKTWHNEKSLLAKGLWENFNFPIRTEHLYGQEGQNLQNLAYDLDSVGFAKSKSSFRLWSFPEASHLYLIDRNNLHNAIVQVASGADPINTTPLKMAEMAARLFSFNKSLKASVLATNQQRYLALEADDSWNGPEKLSAFYSNYLFKAMNDALMTAGGTARTLVGEMLKHDYPNYHFYAKTGTISGNKDNGKRDKHLMLIISKNKLNSNNISPEELKKNRFYVLYFSFYKQSRGADWGNAAHLLREMAKTVMESTSFKTFMHHE